LEEHIAARSDDLAFGVVFQHIGGEIDPSSCRRVRHRLCDLEWITARRCGDPLFRSFGLLLVPATSCASGMPGGVPSCAWRIAGHRRGPTRPPSLFRRPSARALAGGALSHPNPVHRPPSGLNIAFTGPNPAPFVTAGPASPGLPPSRSLPCRRADLPEHSWIFTSAQTFPRARGLLPIQSIKASCQTVSSLF
jgi:hypothetical protein